MCSFIISSTKISSSSTKIPFSKDVILQFCQLGIVIFNYILFSWTNQKLPCKNGTKLKKFWTRDCSCVGCGACTLLLEQRVHHEFGQWQCDRHSSNHLSKFIQKLKDALEQVCDYLIWLFVYIHGFSASKIVENHIWGSVILIITVQKFHHARWKYTSPQCLLHFCLFLTL